MKPNYQLMMEEIIANLDGRPKLLLHACCGVCSSAVLERLLPHFDITILYYNPNIYPEDEYIKRLDTLKKLIKEMKADIKIMPVNYEQERFYEIAEGLESEKEGGSRCSKCYHLRLEKTAFLAQKHGFEYFGTTLSISPYKNAEKLNTIGKALENKYGVKYLLADFKKKDGYKRSNELAREFNLYRQNYCGCEYSLEEVKSKDLV